MFRPAIPIVCIVVALPSLTHLTPLPAQDSCAFPPDSLVGWWTGDDHARDIFGGHDAHGENGATFADGKVGRAFSFDGIDDRVEIDPIPEELQLTGAITIAAWIKPSALFLDVDWSVAIVRDESFRFKLDYHRPENAQYRSSNFGIGWVAGPTCCTGFASPENSIDPPDEWHHVAATRTDSHLVHLYVDGREVALYSAEKVAEPGEGGQGPPPRILPPLRFEIGNAGPSVTGSFFKGLIDEVQIFNRALSPEEIHAIYDTGSEGNCRCARTPYGLVSWWPAENDANDIFGSNDAVVHDVAFGLGKVGSAFSFDGVDDRVEISELPLDPQLTGALTIEAWIKPTSSSSAEPEDLVIAAHGRQEHFAFVYNPVNDSGGSPQSTISFEWHDGAFQDLHSPDDSVTPDEWHHVAVTRDGTYFIRMYVDGEEVANGQGTAPIVGSPPGKLLIGAASSGQVFEGLIDELGIYNRALEEREIEAIYNAGSVGKCNNTLVGSNIGVKPLDQWTGSTPVTVTFDSVTEVGNTSLSIESSGPQLSADYVSGEQPAFFELATTAIPSGMAEVSIDYSGITFQDESRVRLLAYHDGVWTDRTAWVDVANDIASGTIESLSIADSVIFAVLACAEMHAVSEPENTDPCACVLPPSGLVSWWSGDSNANDIFGANHATLLNGVTFSPREIGGAFRFDGIDDRVEIDPIPEDLQLRDALTIAAWIKPSSTPSAEGDVFHIAVCGWHFNLGYTRSVPTQGYSPRTLGFWWTDRTGTPGFGSPENSISLDQWNHVAATRTDSHLIRLYIDGEEVALYQGGDKVADPGEGGQGTAPVIGRLHPLKIGSGQPYWGEADFKGLIDEIQIFNRALTGEEIQGIFNAGSCIPPLESPVPALKHLICSTIAGRVRLAWQKGDDDYDEIQIRREIRPPGQIETVADTVTLPGDTESYVDPPEADAVLPPGPYEYTLLAFRDGEASSSIGCVVNVGEVVILEDHSCDGEPAGTWCADVTLRPAERRAWYKLSPTLGSTITIDLTDEDEADANALYFRWGSPPTDTRYDFAAQERFRPDQRLVVPSSQDAEGYILVQANLFNTEENTVTLRVQEVPDLALESLSAVFVAEGGVINVAVVGAGFDEMTEFRLVDPDGVAPPVEASEVVVVSESRAEVAFDLAGAEVTAYDLEVREAAGATALTEALEVVEAAKGPQLEAYLNGPQRRRVYRSFSLLLNYSNVGDQEAPAPLFRIAAPDAPETELRLASEEEFQTRELLALGISPEGVPHRLAPGSRFEIPVVVRSPHCEPPGAGLPCPLRIEVSLFQPSREDLVGWQARPNPDPEHLSTLDWQRLLGPLSLKLGATWREFHAALAERARRLSRRGVDAASVGKVFRFAAREALGRPSGAIVGTVVHDADGAPVAGGEVVALERGEVVAYTVTDESGRFTLDWLEERKLQEGGYELGVNEHRVVSPPDLGSFKGGDRLGAKVRVVPDAAVTHSLLCPNCLSEGLPERPLVPPVALFSGASQWDVDLFGAVDPNEKDSDLRLGEFDDLAGIRRPQILYTVRFENTGSAPAQSVQIADYLPLDRLDPGTFRIRDLQFESADGERSVNFVTHGYSDTASVMAPRAVIFVPNGGGGQLSEDEVDVNVDVSFDPPTGKLEWRLEAFRPDGSLLNDDEGFLDYAPDQNEGSVTFTVSPLLGLSAEDIIENKAEIVFDEAPPVTTAPVAIQAGELFAPEAPRNPVPGHDSAAVASDASLCWEPILFADHYDVYLWLDGEGRPPEPLARTLEACYRPEPLVPGAIYRWQVVATNLVGGEPQSTEGPEWVFTVETEDVPRPAPGAPSDPSPPDGAEGVARDALLSWSEAEGAALYDVYLWHEDETEPTAPKARGFTGSPFQSAGLEYGELYHWRIVARSGPGPEDLSTPGPVWSFRVQEAKYLERGEVNGDRAVDVSDPVFLLLYLFSEGESPPCLRAADVDDNRSLEVTDAIVLLGYLFLGGAPPEPPAGRCGIDPDDEGDLSCQVECP